jgi:hypothetical protein
MKLLLFLLITSVYSLELNNLFFTTDIINNKIILDKNITIDIKSNKNNYYNMLDDNFLDETLIFDKITIYNDYLNISYEMRYDLQEANGNYLRVSLNILDNDNIILIFNEKFNYNGINIIQMKKYMIIFDDNISHIDIFDNCAYLNFNNYLTNKMIYNFIIKYIL